MSEKRVAMASLLAQLPPVAFTMLRIFATLYGGLAALSLLLEPVAVRGRARGGTWLPPPSNGSKRAGEVLAWTLSPLWIASVGASHRRTQACVLAVRPSVHSPRGLGAVQGLSSRAAFTSAGAPGAT